MEQSVRFFKPRKRVAGGKEENMPNANTVMDVSGVFSLTNGLCSFTV